MSKIKCWAIYLIMSSFFVVNVQMSFAISKAKGKKIKNEVISEVEKLQSKLDKTAKEIWDFSELGLVEYKSSNLLKKKLKDAGFTIKEKIGGLKTAFIASYGKGKPVIGILAEFDALPGLSQRAGSSKFEPILNQAPGHGCGHNIFGVGSMGAVMGVKEIIKKYNLPGTIKFFGCPAEETVEGKVYMAKSGAFSDLDICLDWHPSSKNKVNLNTSNALNNFKVSFHGKTSHAAGDPWNGRSALDGIELLNHGINYLREHVKPTVRIHYVIEHGGQAPNIVPDFASGWYYVRGKDRLEVENVYNRILKIVKGAELMTETSSKVHLITGVYNYLKNKTVAKLLYKNLQLVGAPKFSPAEQSFAKKMQRNVEKNMDGMSTRIEPFTQIGNFWGGASTDAADVSWIVPTASLGTACWPLNVPGHSWCVTASTGFSTGFKGMNIAAKVLAASAVEILLNKKIIKEASLEFDQKTKGFEYKSAIPKDQKPRKH